MTAAKVIIRPLVPEDASFLYTMMQSPQFQKYYLERLLFTKLSEAENYIVQDAHTRKKGTSFSFMILVGKERAGLLNVYKINAKDKRGAIGYALAESFWNQGIATKAVKLGLSFMKKTLKLHTCEGTADPANIASYRVMEKNGFIRVGIIPDYYFEKNKYSDRVLYWKILD